ncbi:unnamed protein product [Prunus brigantina]
MECDDPGIRIIRVRASHTIYRRLRQPDRHVARYGRGKGSVPLLKMGFSHDMMQVRHNLLLGTLEPPHSQAIDAHKEKDVAVASVASHRSL